MFSITKLTLDYVETLHGTDSMPLLGWEIVSDEKNFRQSSYQVQISLNADFSNVIFDSSEVISDASQNVVLEGVNLTRSTNYYVRSLITDANGVRGEWSDTASFFTGRMSDIWSADFITAEKKSDHDNSKGTLLRKEFSLNTGTAIESAFVHVSALGLYNLYLNGEKVGEDELTPGWTSYKKHILYQSYDITGLLKPEGNAIGASLGAGWYKGEMSFTHHRNLYGDRTALILEMIIKYVDGSIQFINTDKTWSGADSPVVFSEIYDGETYDARQELSGWSEFGYVSRFWEPVTVIDQDKSILKPQSNTTIRVIDEVSPRKIIITPAGETVLDFGQNMSGRIRFNTRGKRGDMVLLQHFETLDADGNVYLDNLRTAKQQVAYYLSGEGEEEYYPKFTFHGFRYVWVRVWPGKIGVNDFRAQVLHSDLEPIGFMNSSSEELNQLHSNILWGLKSNFIDVPTDCPQRDERMGWTGDAQIFCRTSAYLTQTRNFFSKWLTDLRHDQLEGGGVPHVIPDIISGRCEDNGLLRNGTDSAAAWSDAAVIIPWMMYLMYGDRVTLRTQYDSMKGWVDFMVSHSDDFRWEYQLQMGDWLALDAAEGSYFGATPTDITNMAYFAYSSQLLSKAAGVLGYTGDEEKYKDIHQGIVRKFQNEFFDADGNMHARTQTAHILALHFGLVAEKNRLKTTDNLINLLRNNNGHLATGFIGTPYLCHALSENGAESEAWRLLLKDDYPSWLYQVKAGATTIWEHWDGLKPDGTMWSADMNSFNHYAYGAIGEWIYRVAAGIDTEETGAGFKRSVIKPVIDPRLDWLDVTHSSLYGDIRVFWKIINITDVYLHVEMEFAIPANTESTVIISGIKELIHNGSLEFIDSENISKAKAGSGEYKIEFITTH